MFIIEKRVKIHINLKCRLFNGELIQCIQLEVCFTHFINGVSETIELINSSL